MKKFLVFLILIIINPCLHSQNKPNYPDPDKGYKRVDLILPKIENKRNCKVEIKFGFETPMIECAEGSFSFLPGNLKEKFGIPNSYRFPYYVLTNDMADIFEEKSSDCNSNSVVNKKILSSQNIFIEYQSSYAIPFYIPESWTLEYRVWEAAGYYTSIKK